MAVQQAFPTLATHLSEVDSPLAAGRAMVTAADQLWQWDAAVLQLYSAERDCLESVLLPEKMAPAERLARARALRAWLAPAKFHAEDIDLLKQEGRL